MKTLRIIISLGIMVALVLPGVSVGAEPDTTASASGAAGIIVKPKPGRGMADLSRSGPALSGKRLGHGTLYRVRAGNDLDKTLAALRADPAVEWAEPDYIRELTVDYTSTPNDPDFADPTQRWHLQYARSWHLRGPGSISADTVWPYLASASATASAFPVAVIDSGFYMTHPDRGPSIVAGKDCFDTYMNATGTLTTDDDVTPVDPSAPKNNVGRASHGTAVASEIAAGVNNGIGTVGAGYDAQVRVYKVQGISLDGIPNSDYGPGSAVILDSAVINAIKQATDDGCKVISMSLGGPDPSEALQDAIDYAHAKGVLVVAASGNADPLPGPVQYPAACEHVIGVGSYGIDSNAGPTPVYTRSAFTNYGRGLDLLAPGESIWGFIKPDYDADGSDPISRPGYTFWSGTSMAAPLVAGGAAALWRLAPELSNDELANVLFRSARDMGPAGYDTGHGWGAFNMAAARSTIHLTVTPVEGTAGTGTDRIGTAIAASRVAFEDKGSPYVLIATAYNWPDALGASALAGELDAPILLTRHGELPAPVAAEIARLGAEHVIVLGGTNAVSESVLRRLGTLPGVDTVERIAGLTRYETVRKLTSRLVGNPGSGWIGRALVVTGEAFPDALGGAPLATANGWPVYLVHPDPGRQSSLVSQMRADGVSSVLVLGGTRAVPLAMEAKLDVAFGRQNVTRLGGATRYETAAEVARYGVDHAELAWDELAIATGEDFPDALAGGVMQGHGDGVILFARPASLPEVTRAELSAHADVIHEVRFLGGSSALTPVVRERVTAALLR